MRRCNFITRFDRAVAGPLVVRAQRRHTSRYRILAPALIWVVSILSVASAANGATKPPSALLGKSVLLSWQETRIERRAGSPDFHPVSGTIKLTIYIGTDGHVFNRYGNITSGRTFQDDQVAGANRVGRPWQFEGTSMRTITPFIAVKGKPSAARNITVNFRNEFTQCSVSSTWAKENGSGTTVTASPHDRSLVETQSVSSAAESCIVQSGNVFVAQ